MGGNRMNWKSIKPAGFTLMAVATLMLWIAQPAVWAANSSATEEAQEETVYEALKRKANEWFGSDDKSAPAKPETPPQAEKPPEKQSDGRKVIDKFKKRMKTASDNLSETVDRDKKTVQKKMNKLFGEKKK